MSLLSPEELSEMQAFATGQEPEQDAEQEQQEPERQQEVQQEEPEQQAEVKEEPSAPQEPRKHTVPYERLQQTIRERNEARSQIAAMQQRVARLESLAQQRNAVSSQVRAELEREGLIDAATGQVEDAGDPRVQQLMGHIQNQQNALQQLQVAQAQQSLTVELADIQSKFPIVPREYLLKAVVADETVSLEEVAHQFMAWVAPHLPPAQAAQNQRQAPAARAPTTSAPPRPAKAGAASSSPGSSEVKGWGDRKSRITEVQAMLKEMGLK